MFYWTSTTYAQITANARVISFFDGKDGSAKKVDVGENSKYDFVCVRKNN